MRETRGIVKNHSAYKIHVGESIILKCRGLPVRHKTTGQDALSYVDDGGRGCRLALIIHIKERQAYCSSMSTSLTSLPSGLASALSLTGLVEFVGDMDRPW